jgi:small neutral amino acid transporter SnatA (MarC family)
MFKSRTLNPRNLGALQNSIRELLTWPMGPIVTVLPVINPVVCGAIFLTLTPKLESRQKWQAAVSRAGHSAYGISLDVFRIVGGIIAYMGLDMLSSGHKVAQAPPPSSRALGVRSRR